MGLAYLLGLSVPLIGAIGLAVLIMKVMQQNEPFSQHEHTRNQRREYCNYNRTKQIVNSDPCSICLELLNGAGHQVLKCGHTFHSKCIDQLLLRQITICPNCRATIL